MRIWMALVILTLIGGFAAIDHYYLHWDSFIFLTRQLIRITTWMAFWR